MRSLAYWLALAFVFTVPWEAAVHIPEIGRGSKVVGLVAGIVWFASVIERGRLRQPDPFQKAYFLFLIWCGVTFYWTIDTDATLPGFVTFVQIFLLLLLVWDLFVSRRAVEAALQAYVLGAFVTCGSIIANYLTAPAARFPAHERVNALGFETDGVALIVAIAGPAAWYLGAGPTSGERSFTIRRLNYAYVPVGLMALVLTGTRGATLASIPTAIFVLWSLRRASGMTRAMAVVAVVVAAGILVQVAPRGQLARIGTAVTATQLGDESSALSGRWSIWTASTHAFLDRPIGGVGLDAHRAAVASELEQARTFTNVEKEAHNTYLSVLTEMGIVGFILFANVLFRVAVRVRELRGWEAWYWTAQLAVLAIGAMSLSLEDSKSVWIFLSCAVAFAAAERSPAYARRQTQIAAGIQPVGRPHPLR
jgi:O-antigen ligase